MLFDFSQSSRVLPERCFGVLGYTRDWVGYCWRMVIIWVAMFFAEKRFVML